MNTISFLFTGESAEDLQNHIARLQERLASENDPPSSAAPLSTDADSKKLERIRLLQRQLDLCQQRAKELENQPLGSSAQKRVVGASGAAGSVRTYANGVGNGVKGAAAKGVSAVSQPVVKGGLPGPRRAVERSRENGAQPEGKTGGLPRSSGTVAATRGGVNGASQPPARESPSRPQQTAAAKAQGGAAIGADKPLSLSNAEEIDDVTGALVAWMVNWKSRSSGSAPTSGRGTGTVAPSGEEGRLPGGSSVARAVENGPPGKKQKVEVGNSEVLQVSMDVFPLKEVRIKGLEGRVSGCICPMSNPCPTNKGLAVSR